MIEQKYADGAVVQLGPGIVRNWFPFGGIAPRYTVEVGSIGGRVAVKETDIVGYYQGDDTKDAEIERLRKALEETRDACAEALKFIRDEMGSFDSRLTGPVECTLSNALLSAGDALWREDD